MPIDDAILWSAESTERIRTYASAAGKWPRSSHLLPVFGSIALGLKGRPDISLVELDDRLGDRFVRAFYPILR